MTAKQAHSQSENANNFKHNKQYNEIVSLIERHSKYGIYYIFYFEAISNEIISKLTKDGFTIKDISDTIRNEVEYKISW